MPSIPGHRAFLSSLESVMAFRRCDALVSGWRLPETPCRARVLVKAFCEADKASQKPVAALSYVERVHCCHHRRRSMLLLHVDLGGVRCSESQQSLASRANASIKGSTQAVHVPEQLINCIAMCWTGLLAAASVMLSQPGNVPALMAPQMAASIMARDSSSSMGLSEVVKLHSSLLSASLYVEAVCSLPSKAACIRICCPAGTPSARPYTCISAHLLLNAISAEPIADAHSPCGRFGVVVFEAEVGYAAEVKAGFGNACFLEGCITSSETRSMLM
jgi:hypothetical protein